MNIREIIQTSRLQTNASKPFPKLLIILFGEPFNEEVSFGPMMSKIITSFYMKFEKCAENRLPNDERPSWKRRDISDILCASLSKCE